MENIIKHGLNIFWGLTNKKETKLKTAIVVVVKN